MKTSWKDSIYRQREELARMLREPLELLAEKCLPVWGDRDGLNTVLLQGISSIPYCTYLYVVGTNGVQISDYISNSGLILEHYHFNHSERPYMKEAMPARGFLLSDAYINQEAHRPSLTALQVIVSGAGTMGYLGADFDLRGLPVTSAFYLRTASINIFNGMVSLTFSCDGSHYMRYDEFLAKGATFWSGAAG